MKKSTRKSLAKGIISLIISVILLVGSTLAWFSATRTINANRIVGGNLALEVSIKNSDGDWVSVQNSDPFFSNAVWTPGHTEYVTFKVENKGSLDLKYKMYVTPVNEVGGINIYGEAFKLSDYLVFNTTEPSSAYAEIATREQAQTLAGSTTKLNQSALSKLGSIEAGDGAEYVTLIVYMPSDVNDKVNFMQGTTAPSIEFGVTFVASIDECEDSFGTYTPADSDTTEIAYNYKLQIAKAVAVGTPTDLSVDYKVGTKTLYNFEVPAERISTGADFVEFFVTNTDAPATLSYSSAIEGCKNFEITANGLNNSTEYVEVSVFVGAGLTGVEVYHNGTSALTAVNSVAELTSADKYYYDAENGYVYFTTATFSPFSVVFDLPAAVSGEGTMDETYYSTADAAQTAANGGKTVYAYRNIKTGEAGFSGTLDMNAGDLFEAKAISVNNVCYPTIAAAVAAAPEGATVKLLANVTLTEDVTVNKSVTIDKNSYTLTGSEHIKSAEGYSRITDIDKNYPNKIFIFKKMTPTAILEMINNCGGKLVIDKNIELDNSTDKSNLDITLPECEIDLNGHILHLKDKALKLNGKYVLNICDSTYHYEGNGSNENNHKLTMGAIWGTNCLAEPSGGAVVNIWGGFFHANAQYFVACNDGYVNVMDGFIEKCFESWTTSNNRFKVAGGQFKGGNPSDRNIENTNSENGILPKGTSGSHVAMIEPSGEMHGYTTLTDAIDAIGTKSLSGKVTIMIKDDRDETVTIPTGANVIINLDGHTLAGNITVEDGASLTVKNHIDTGSVTATVTGAGTYNALEQ